MLILTRLLPIALLAFGIVFLPIADLVSKFVPQWASLICLFLIYNFVISKKLGLEQERQTAWDFKKIYQLFFGFLVGAIPISIYFIFRAESFSFQPFSFLALLTTLAIVSWEELWFRGMPLELAAKKYSRLGSAAAFGLMFVALHLLNPKINLLHDGLGLFLAGYSLSLIYLVFGSIWISIGLHFANNFIESVAGMPVEPKSPSYLVPLAIIAIVLTLFHKKRISSPSKA